MTADAHRKRSRNPIVNLFAWSFAVICYLFMGIVFVGIWLYNVVNQILGTLFLLFLVILMGIVVYKWVT